MCKRNMVWILIYFLLGCSGNNFQTVGQKSNQKADAVYSAEVDLLLVVDNSFGTMLEHQDRISDRMDVFYEGLVGNKADFRIAATTMDMSNDGENGRLVEGETVVSKETPNAVNKLKKLIKRGGEGSDLERGLDALEAVLKSELTYPEEKRRFLRDDALLVITFITDDRDFSKNSAQDSIDLLNEMKGYNTENNQNWIVNFIGITDLKDPTCTTYNNYSARGEAYIQMAKESGGVSESICKTDFRSVMNQIKVRLKSVLNRYKLKYVPILDSIEVKKNGVTVRQSNEDGWSFDPVKNVIVLNGSARPKENDELEIKYEIDKEFKN